MCCNAKHHHGMQGWGHRNVCQYSCNDPESYRPRFISKKQKIANLKAHLEVLRDEAKAVEEMIAEIKKCKQIDMLK